MTETDILIIGSGPAGCTAAIYGVRAGFKTLILSGPAHGGQLVRTHELENFPGFINPLSGFEVMDSIHKQCQRLGIEFASQTVVKIEEHAKPFVVHCAGGKQIKARAVIVATGSTAAWLGVEGEKKFIGRGVSSCATCDGFFYKNKAVCVIGGGNKAFEEALFLTNFCSKVYLIHRREGFRAHKVTINKALANAKIELLVPYVVAEVKGDDTGVKSVALRNTNDNSAREIEVSGVFVSVGTVPQTDFLRETSVNLTPGGHVIATVNGHTNVQGIFAAGDCARANHNQAIVAAGSGAVAGMEAVAWLNE